MDINSCGPRIDIAGIYNCVIRLIIAISNQAINYVIHGNPEKLYKSLVRSQLEYALVSMGHLSLRTLRKRSQHFSKDVQLNLS